MDSPHSSPRCDVGGREEEDEDIDEEEEDEEVKEDTQAILAREAIKFAEDEDDADDEDDEDDEDDDEDRDMPDTMKAAHFFMFKQFFSQAEAAALIASAEEGGALFKAMDAAYDSWRAAMEADDDEEEEDDAEGEVADEEESDEDEDEFDWAEQVPWKDETDY